MPVPRVSLVPVGRMDPAELEGAAQRVAKVLRASVAIREPVAIPRGTEDAARGQHDAARLLSGIRAELPRGKTAKTVGADLALAASAGFTLPPSSVGPSGSPPKPSAGPSAPAAAPGPEVFVFVTDVDLFAPNTDGVWTHLGPPHRAALVSVRRLREAFYRRKADPAAQRSRLVKEILRVVARSAGLPDCNDPRCSLSVSLATGELDRKAEQYCAACWKRLSLGTMRL